MPEAISSIGKVFANPSFSKIANTGLAGVGTVGNILQQNRYNGIYDQYGKLLSDYQNPQILASKISALQQPLSTGLQQGVGNAVQAAAAERGLSQAPGLFNSMLSQALAPYQMELQKNAISALGLPFQANPAAALATGKPVPADLSGIFQKLQGLWGQGGGAVGNITPNLPLNQAPGIFNYPLPGVNSGSGGTNSFGDF